jgi:hypothetical protein
VLDAQADNQHQQDQDAYDVANDVQEGVAAEGFRAVSAWTRHEEDK